MIYERKLEVSKVDLKELRPGETFGQSPNSDDPDVTKNQRSEYPCGEKIKLIRSKEAV